MTKIVRRIRISEEIVDNDDDGDNSGRTEPVASGSDRVKK